MKKLFATLMVAFVCNSVLAQPWLTNGTHIYNSNTGNVGIRTSSPVFPFQVWDGGSNTFTGTSIIPGNNPQENSIINTMKSAGYGSVIRTQSQDAGKGQAGIFLRTSDGASIPSQVTLMADHIDFRTGKNYNDDITNGNTGQSALFINWDRNVGIGTTIPGPFKLAVEGKIGAREIKVTTAAWADYVFASDYKLLSLRELEAYIKKNNHLPNIPSAKEVKENEGIELGAMNVKLLEKIEELTLHLIEVNKRLEAIEQENAKLREAKK
ncbi:hypothetical protein [Paraflavitalea sp. CAU 1676]|uniref:hypothetical protein n=1 Tax=Paraflavitalea sp. CAU 1676 TaxID=3032598 RepID=UPI0023DAD3B9|nr:hypothetical protein [Paraflavitalea sp. CAU 1676]MDF2192998.1 hypothetical protein [Paraflavitalea sp. CAU 1676]